MREHPSYHVLAGADFDALENRPCNEARSVCHVAAANWLTSRVHSHEGKYIQRRQMQGLTRYDPSVHLVCRIARSTSE